MRFVPLLAVLLTAALTVAHAASSAARAWAWKAMLALGLALTLSGFGLGLFWAPSDEYMGDVQRILYVHVPVLWAGLLALVLNFGASVSYLWKESSAVDAFAEATAEVGVAFGLIGLVIGAVWGRPTWGVWWSWDPRMTATAAMLALYTVYLVVRYAVRDSKRRAFLSAVMGCLVSVLIPVVWFSVRWWKSLHQLQSTTHTMDPSMLITLEWTGAGLLCLFWVLVWQRYLLARRAPAA